MTYRIKLFLVLGVILFSTFTFTSCNLNHSSINSEFDSNSDITSNNVDNSLYEEDIFVDAILRQDFYLNGVHYVMNLEKKISFDETYDLLGYFVNACDLEYWMSFDNDSSLVYAVEENSTLVRHHLNENLKNRFELYSVDLPNAIGLKCNDIYIYERKIYICNV